MLFISIDLGSYSVKFLHYRLGKKETTLEATDEIVLEYPEDDKNETNEYHLFQIQLKTVALYLEDISEEYQITMNFSSELISTRFVTIPGKSKKRASMMLPFQIEEDLPFSLSDSHFSEIVELVGNNCEVTAGIIRKDHFEAFYNGLEQYGISPKTLTNDVSNYLAYVKENHTSFPTSFCILELGHEAVRGYFFHEGNLVSNHHSFVAGKIITEDIAKTYNISIDEATIYKHQNAFVLTDHQSDQVNENQREFAKMMDTSLQSLVNEIRRWEIGFRVKNGTPATCFYTCGGSANIKNINHYLKSNLNTEVKPFNPYPTCNDRKFDQEPKYRAKFSQAVVMAQMSRTKSRLINFLRGEFALNGNASLPIHNLVFLGVRASFVAILVSAFFLLDTVMIKRDLKVAKKRSTSLLKQPIFKISGREIRRVLTRNPEKILKKLNKQNKQFEQEVKMIQSSVKTNAIKSLNDIIAMVSGLDVEILQFHSINSDEFNLQLKAKSVKVIDELENLFNNSEENKFFVEKDSKNLTINISGEEKK